MQDDTTPLQRFINAAVALMPKKRDHYDRILQERLSTKGKPIYDIARGKSRNPSIAQLNAIAEVLGQPRALIERAISGEEVQPTEPTFTPREAIDAIVEQFPREAAVGENTFDPAVGTGLNLKSEMGAGKTRAYTEVIENAVTLRSFDLSYAMGPGTNIDDYVEEGTYKFDPDMLSRLTRAPHEKLFVARGDGDSMFPTLMNDDTVVIDTTQRVVNLRDRIWACSIHGAGAIKRLRPAADGKVEIISDNPAVKDDLVDATDIHIVGRVIWLGRRV